MQVCILFNKSKLTINKNGIVDNVNAVYGPRCLLVVGQRDKNSCGACTSAKPTRTPIPENCIHNNVVNGEVIYHMHGIDVFIKVSLLYLTST